MKPTLLTPFLLGLGGGLLLLVLGTLGSPDLPTAQQNVEKSRFSILVFSKTDTAGFRHASIPDGIEALQALGTQHNFAVDTTEDASMFKPERLSPYDAVVFLSTSGNVLNKAQQAAFEQYIQSGGGYVGIHGAAATEYDWDWYGDLVGAFFDDHPEVQAATLQVRDSTHSATQHLPSPWTWTDEWYNYRSNPSDDVHVLLTLDESSYDGGTMGNPHPISWVHTHEDGRAFYTGLGHTKAAYRHSLFRKHLLGGIEWVVDQSTE